MKTGIIPHTLFIIICFFFNVALFAQSLNDSIIAIDQKVKIINLDTAYSIATFKDESFLDSSFINQAGIGYGELKGYFNNGNLCKIYELVGIKKLNDIAVTEYYFANNELIYISETENYNPAVLIDSNGTVDYKAKEPDFFGQYYFSQNKLVQKNIKGKQAILPNELYFDSQSKQAQLLEYANKYRTLLLIKYKQ